MSIADTLLASGVTAAIAYNDIVALGLVSRLTARGANVPRDLSIVGFDGTALAAMVPPLTSVSVPRSAAARRAVAFLLDKISAPAGPIETVVLPTQLIVRSSTGVVRSG